MLSFHQFQFVGYKKNIKNKTLVLITKLIKKHI